MRLVDWDDFKFFSAVAETGSVRGAATQLGVNASTVSRRVDQLESRLGVRLFSRHAGGLHITDDGAEVAERLASISTQLADIERQLSGRDQRLSGVVKVTLPDLLAVSFLLRDLRDFAAAQPDIQLEFLPAYRELDLARREADVAIRATDAPPLDLIGQPLGRYALAVYGNRNYVERFDPVSKPTNARWISWTGSDAHGRFVAELRANFAEVPEGYRCDNVLLQLAAVRAGLGITALPCALADPISDIMRVDDEPPLPGLMLWLLTHPDLRGSRRITEFTAYVRSVFLKREDQLLGNLGSEA